MGKRIFICEQCGKEFAAIYEAKRKFCCRACSKANTAKRNARTCKTCGKQFVRFDRHRGDYCSHPCYAKSLIGSRPANYAGGQVVKTCATCGKQFSVDRYRQGKAKYCSRPCAGKAKPTGEANSRYRKIVCTCDYCGKPLSRAPHRIRDYALQFCNHRCHGDWKAANLVGDHNPLWKGGIPDYGENWPRQGREARARDGHKCRVCGVTEKKLGRKLDVHHIVPLRTFKGDYRRANALANLISLCKTCHQLAEHGKIAFQPALF